MEAFYDHLNLTLENVQLSLIRGILYYVLHVLIQLQLY